MPVLSDKWIKKMALKGMISPFEEKQIREGKISYGLSSYGYDARVSNEFKIFTNINSDIVDPKNFKLTKGQDFLTLYQYHTKVAEHYFCSKCGIYTHSNPRSNHDKVYMLNVACIEGVKPFELKNIVINDGTNHPLDKKK